MTQEELLPLIINSIYTISARMDEIIYKKYFDNVDNNNKYLLRMFDDAFKTASVICYSFSLVALTQAGDLIRKLIEQTAIVTILTNDSSKLPKYVEHYKLRKEISDMERKEQKATVVERFKLSNSSIDPFKYLDYGWISEKCNETKLIEEAGFSDFIAWKQIYLNKFVHSSFTNIDLIGKEHNFPILKPLVEITAKAFDHLCCAFHKTTGFDFVVGNKDLFQNDFRKLYCQLD